MYEYLTKGAFKDAIIYYTTVIIACEVGRYICDKSLNKNSNYYKFAIEFFGTLQVTTTIYENAVIDIYLGRQMFAITIFTMGLVFAFCTRGAFCGPLAPLEQFIFGKTRLSDFVRTIGAQFLAGYFSYRFARTIWMQTYLNSEAHTSIIGIYETCGFNHQYPIYFHLLFELIGTFVVRHVITRATSENQDSRVRFFFPALFMAMLFTGTVTYIGDQALDPLVASTLFFGCRGLDLQHFILVYWLAPIIGWLLSAYWDSLGEASMKRRIKKNNKKATKSE